MGAGTVNKVILIGNLGKDPEIRTTQDGREIANLTIATSEHWTDKNSGERREKTEWHKVVIFNPNLVQLTKKYIHKGSKVFVEGQLQTRKWQDQSGADKYTTEVVIQGFNGSLTFLDRPTGGGAQSGGNNDYAAASGNADSGGGATREQFQAAELDDEIPF
jgi:single-strand DNA-binding protein